jgi:hypothetical protein
MPRATFRRAWLATHTFAALTSEAHCRQFGPGRENQPYLDQLPTLAIFAMDQRLDLGRILRSEVLEVPFQFLPAHSMLTKGLNHLLLRPSRCRISSMHKIALPLQPGNYSVDIRYVLCGQKLQEIPGIYFLTLELKESSRLVAWMRPRKEMG